VNLSTVNDLVHFVTTIIMRVDYVFTRESKWTPSIEKSNIGDQTASFGEI